MNSTQTSTAKNSNKFVPNKNISPAMQAAVEQYNFAVSRKLKELKQLLKAATGKSIKQ